MTRSSWISLSLRVASALMALRVLCPFDARAAGADSEVMQKLEALEQGLGSLRQENRSLRQEVSALKRQLESGREQTAALKQELETVSKTASDTRSWVPKAEAMMSDMKEREQRLPFEIGFRQGWMTAPFGLSGGFAWQAFLSHTLLAEEEGMPYGDLRGEIAIELMQGNQRPMRITTLTNVGPLGNAIATPVNIKAAVTGANVLPSVQYHFRRMGLLDSKLESFEPYVFAGPAIFISAFEFRPLNAGQLVLPPELRARGIPTVGSAHVFAGGQFGLGINYELRDIAGSVNLPIISPILARTRMGPQFRWNLLENGEDAWSWLGAISIGL